MYLREGRGVHSNMRCANVRWMSDAPSAPVSPLAQPHPWSKVSSGYDKFTRGFLAKYSEKGLAELDLKPEHVFLDVACGPGTVSLIASPQVRAVQALDFSPEMVELCRAHLGRSGISNVETRVADGQDLPFDDETFDRAVSMFGLMFFPDRIRGMREMRRCLKPGGRALISSWAPVSRSPLMRAMFDAGRAANPESPPPKENPESLENPEVFERELREAGFSNIRIEPCFCAYDYGSGEQLWEEMVEGAVPLVMARESMPKDEWESFSKKCRRYLMETFEGAPELGSTAYLAFAER